MTKERRNKLSSSRHQVLKQPGVIYTIRCPGTGCNCIHIGPDCQRGFFSLWIQAIYGLCFAHKLDIPSIIDFGDKPYLYSDPIEYPGDLNFWNYFYHQDADSNGRRTIPNKYIENYPLRIWQRSHFRKVHLSAVRGLVLKERIQSYINELIEPCKKYTTLGVHIRMTDHSSEIESIPLNSYIKILQKKLKKYQKIYVSTDDCNVLELLISEFGSDRILYQNAVRSENKEAVHTNRKHTNRYQLGLQVLADCYALSVCQETVLVHSNVSYAVLLLNPSMRYTLLESHKSRNNRWKTGLLYQLDRWGIRKM